MMRSQGMMGGQLFGYGILGMIVGLLVIGAVVYIAVRLALKHHK